MSAAVTNGVRVAVESTYLKQQSAPSQGRFAFSYTVKITNNSDATVQLKSRHWVITDADQTIREVKGEGVVGEQPVLSPGQSYEYTSGSILSTAWGTMHGSYQFVVEGGAPFDAEIAPFLLASSSVETARELN